MMDRIIQKKVRFDDDKKYPEVAALFDICSLFRDYPRDFVKSESPDWVNDSIGLEVALAVSPETFQRLNRNVGSMRLGEVVNQSFDDDGYVLYKAMVKGQIQFFFYDLKARYLYIPGKEPLPYDYLSDEEKEILKDSLPYTLGNHLRQLDSGAEPFELGFEQFRIKTCKLQSYQSKDFYHLYLYSDHYADERLAESFLNQIVEFGNEFDKNFDILFLRTINGIYRFVLKDRKYEFVKCMLLTYESYYSNIHNPSDWNNYSFKDVVIDIPDLRRLDTNDFI